MKGVRLGLVILAAVMITIGFAGYADAFHSGGVAECTGCHTMHRYVSDAKATGVYLLKGTDQSSTCLNCHNQPDTAPSSYHISTDESKLGAGIAPVERTPGGDFAWLKKSYTWTGYGAPASSPGERHGHNIVAVDYNYVVDSTNAQAPGGTYDATKLHCSSCHDPHNKYRRVDDSGGALVTTGAPIIASGSYSNSIVPSATQAVGVYRILGGVGYAPQSYSAIPFTAAPPKAAAPSTYNQTEATNQVRVAYGTGMSEWCANCHTGMHTSSGRLVHPVAQNLGSTIAANYNSYVKSGDMTGTSTTSYLSLVPFEEGAATTYTDLKAHASNTNANLNGPASNSQVMCLSCHRAHASGWDDMLRWNAEKEFITVNGFWPGTDSTDSSAKRATTAQGRTVAETQAAYYDRAATTFATHQRQLCNKCHAKD